MASPEEQLREFRELGRDSVRAEIRRRRWEPAKLALARQWLEREDTKEWMAAREGAKPKQRPAWIKKAWSYIAAGMGLAYVAMRLVRLLRYGA